LPIKCHICGEEITGSYLEHMKKHQKTFAPGSIKPVSSLVNNLREGCKLIGGELTESETLIKCDLEEAKITLRKDGEWMKYYELGKLRIWGKPENISYTERYNPITRKTARILFLDWKEPKLGVTISFEDNIGFISPGFREDERYIAPQFMEEYMKKLRRLERIRKPRW